MTQMEETGTKTRRPFTWSIKALGNRFAYSFVVAILVNIALGNEALSLVVGGVLFIALTAIVTVIRRRTDS